MKGQIINIERRSVKKILVNLLITVVFGIIYFYIKLPPINLHSPAFYTFFFLLAAVYCVTSIITSGIWRAENNGDFFRSVKYHCGVPLLICIALLVFGIIGTFFSSVIIRSSAYSSLLTVTEGNFEEDVDEISFDRIPLLDAASAEKLGDRKLGELSDMVSQFEVANNYTQINYQGRPVRVTPLEYGDLIKWFNNRSNGLPAYIIIDMVTQEVEVVRLKEGMKYSTNEHFMRNLERYLRFKYPTFMFDTPVFEIDEEGNPFWICPKLEKTIGLFGGTDINGAVLVNAVTGECQYYTDVPSWVDRVYSSDLIIEQYDYYGMYSGGFLNSIFGQKGVTVTTDGYNYIAINDDVFMYTGITSVGGDESNIGFILSNQRTKETKYYAIAGAEEYSAMSSAQGVVQHLNYTATFPLLLNIHSQPTYFMALKDNAGLVKMYAMVNVSQYQVVATGNTVSECEEAYSQLLLQNNITSPENIISNELSGEITDIREAVIDGNSFYYMQIDNSDEYYSISAAENESAIILNPGDMVRITYSGSDGSKIFRILTLELI